MRKQAGLYLDFDVSPDRLETSRDLLGAIAAQAEIACLLIRQPSEAGREANSRYLRPLVLDAQKRGVATLIWGSAQAAVELGADGVHVPWSRNVAAQFLEARRLAGPNTIVGGDAGRSRHDAMQLGEAGADYVAFGIPDSVEDRERAAERRLELVAWWSEIFEIPCVALDVADARAARDLFDAGADFVSFRVAQSDVTAEMESKFREHAEALVTGGTTS